MTKELENQQILCQPPGGTYISGLRDVLESVEYLFHLLIAINLNTFL